MPIRSFADKATADLWNTGTSRAFPGQLHSTMIRKLLAIDAAQDIGDLKNPPGNRLEKLEDDTWSIRVNNQYRVIFAWSPGQADDVIIYDPH